MSKYKRRLLKNNQRKSDAPWVNDEIRNEVKKRNKLNKEKRNRNHVTKRELYIKQKKIVQTKIREQMNIYEMKITNDIRQDRSRGKKIWENINKLRGTITDRDKKVVLYTAENEQILIIHETEHEIEQYWTTSYRKHQNEIDKVWNKERKCVYQEIIEKEMKDQGYAIHGNTTFPMVL